MATIASRQITKAAAGTKLSNVESLGRLQMVTITGPATAAYAQNDTINSAVILPTGTKITLLGQVARGAFGASVTMNVGLKAAADDSVISATAIASAVDVSAAGVSALNNGAACFATGTPEYVTTVPSYIYATLAGANPTDDTQFRIDIPVVLPG